MIAAMAGVFATTAVNPAGANGLLAGNPGQVGVQLAAVGATVALSGALTWGIVSVLRLVMRVRVSIDTEILGVDQSEHGEEAYHGGDIGELTGRHVALGESVLIPHTEMRP